MGFLAGKRVLITGLLSNRSIAYGIAKAARREGGVGASLRPFGWFRKATPYTDLTQGLTSLTAWRRSWSSFIVQ